MSSTQKNYKWIYLPTIIALSFIAAIVIIVIVTSQNHPHFPPGGCGEARRPSLEYQGITYFQTASVTSADLGQAITTIGDGPGQATSLCLRSGATVYSVKGYPITARLAVGLRLFEPYTPTPTSSSTAHIRSITPMRGAMA